MFAKLLSDLSRRQIIFFHLDHSQQMALRTWKALELELGRLWAFDLAASEALRAEAIQGLNR